MTALKAELYFFKGQLDFKLKKYFTSVFWILNNDFHSTPALKSKCNNVITCPFLFM